MPDRLEDLMAIPPELLKQSRTTTVLEIDIKLQAYYTILVDQCEYWTNRLDTARRQRDNRTIGVIGKDVL